MRQADKGDVALPLPEGEIQRGCDKPHHPLTPSSGRRGANKQKNCSLKILILTIK